MQTEVPTWRRFVSEAETNGQIAEFARKKAKAESGLAQLETKMEQIADRFYDLSSNLRSCLKRAPGVEIDEEQRLRNSLKFGPESGINVDGLIGMVEQRDFLARSIKDYEDAIRKRLH